jgi:IgGFc binding protein
MRRRSHVARRSPFVLGVVGVAIACIPSGCGAPADRNAPADTIATAYDAGADGFANGGAIGGVGGFGGSATDGGNGPPFLPNASLTASGDPQTCDQATAAHSYIGCDYWPTVVANNVWSIFDFAVVVANAGATAADVAVSGPSGTAVTATVPPGQLAKLFLPWVPALKGADSNNCGEAVPLTSSVLATAAAFHLTSSAPVTVYQFNALEYQGQGGPPGKSWSACPGSTTCENPNVLMPIGCFSFSNDASLLLPSTAMTGSYRVAGHEGIVLSDPASGQVGPIGGYMAITATQDGTTVKVQVSATGEILAGAGVAATSAGGTLGLSLDAGDVAELVAPGGDDLSGSLVQASAPVQVITGHPCIQIPPTEAACDHIEESVFPAETLGKTYVVTRPAGPTGAPVSHQVRIYGNVDGTLLTYDPSPPPGCPTTINAGQVAECGTPACPNPMMSVSATPVFTCGTTSVDFEVTGTQPFAVGTFTIGASAIASSASTAQDGDPAQSFAIAVEQFRSSYVFLAPSDYTFSYVDIVAKPGTAMALDSGRVLASAGTIGFSGYSVYRVALGAGQAGAHTLIASQPVGIQVVGYGAYTSYMYPGGLDLAQIAPPPPLF